MKVTCICPTANRPELLVAAMKLFHSQTFTDAELVILDDGVEQSLGELQVLPWKQQLLREQRIRYYYEKTDSSLGDKHNRLVELARGEYIMHWPDDDWFAPWRIAYQVGLLEQFGWDMCTTSETLWIDADKKKAWHWNPPDPRNYNAAELCYRREVWESAPYEDVATGEDAAFVRSGLANGFSLGLKLDYRFVVQRIHANNTASNQQMHNDWLTSFEDVKAVVGKDWDSYFGGTDGLPH
jgi:glycosyltransferase involved in cell wall biosynthesis